MMKRLVSKEDVSKKQLDILEFIDTTCKENNIEYSLVGGSLLGAIRHKGFIPWDDDIDVMLTRDNYNKLMKVLMSKKDTRFTLIYYKNMKAYMPFTKLCDNETIIESKTENLNRGTGVFVDIFPYDFLPNEAKERNTFRSKILNKARYLSASKRGKFDYATAGTKSLFLAKVILFLPLHLIYLGKEEALAQKLDDAMQSYKASDSKYMGYILSRYREKEVFPKEIFEEYEDIQFENLKVRKIKNHDAYLEQLFGDYMILPPENQRETHDYYRFYWKEGK
ncbi:LicD family protein [Lactococcus petauri]|uniref:LicD family protein n=1 Tax=Lactococcus petauri TaxID=1940789 RepID=A0AAJ2IZ98_9LACT|nr:LicD family protein [Lactococcus petauri]MDT2527603.1 LicD family protein [Lactococcus petauri]MDT2542161.1 LicD family protein [Lactococcus petauri]MDT2558746.1 LicD family protein [Lactococcus petauri]MDT2560869.1 LicD family protein [Lactococcus petauri]MDT2561896.1 LicD family protein [Lactococcus petauri]